MATAMAVGCEIKVNGKAFRITRAGSELIQLEGKRGGWASLVQNKKSGAWQLVTERGSKLVTSFEVAA